MLLFSQLFHWLRLFYVIFQHIAVRTKYRCKIEGASNFNFRVTLFLRLSWTDVVLKLSIYHDCGFQWPLNNTIIIFLKYRHTLLPLRLLYFLNIHDIEYYWNIFCALFFFELVFTCVIVSDKVFIMLRRNKYNQGWQQY